MTDLGDIGWFIAEASLRKDIKNRDVHVRGDEKTIEEIAHLLYGPQVKLQMGSSISALKQDIDSMLERELKPQEMFLVFIKQLRWIVLSQIAQAERYDNEELFPNIKTKTYAEFEIFQTTLNDLIRNFLDTV